MPIRDLLWACPFCREFGSIRTERRRETCHTCGARFRRDRGATIAGHSATALEILSADDWERRLPDPATTSPDRRLGPQTVRLRWAEPARPVHHQGRFVGWAERFGPESDARFLLTRTEIVISPNDGPDRHFRLEELRAIQPSSASLQLNTPIGLLSVRFLEDSVRRWEALIQENVRQRLSALGRGAVVAFQPHIRTEGPDDPPTQARPRNDADPPVVAPSSGPTGAHSHTPDERGPALYRILQFIARNLWRLNGGIDIDGLQNLPATGPALLIANHQSFLDPILIQSHIRRPVHAMAKSTQFSSGLVGPIMHRICSFPVRRYQTDPQAVRTALRLLGEGKLVAIYIEGERSWNGRLQEPRTGSVRLALRAGVPVIPTVISGSYDAWPRWDRRPGRQHVRIRILPPIRLPRLRGVANRKAVPDTARFVMKTLQDELDSLEST